MWAYSEKALEMMGQGPSYGFLAAPSRYAREYPTSMILDAEKGRKEYSLVPECLGLLSRQGKENPL
jgi:hypothetical protein